MKANLDNMNNMTTKQSSNKTSSIQTSAIGKAFGKGTKRVVALESIDLELYAGEITLLMGPSGSGKSSLLSVLGGLQAPDYGSVKVLGKDLWNEKKNMQDLGQYRRANCGFVFQSVGLFPALTALEQIVIPLKLMGFATDKAQVQALEMLKQVGLATRSHSRPHEMSGGENQRVAIARMLAKGPKLIFCDEPTSALDSESGAVVAELLKKAASKHKAMVLCVTHDDRLQPYADRLLKIADGKITFDSQEKN